jgi:Phosphatidylserine/phosphatidylglycerophosphate/cardiolipin synthases and related enzymes
MEFFRHIISHPIIPHFITVGIFLLGFFFVARLLAEKRQPGNTFAWMLIILLAPYVGVPLYLIFGGRKFRRLIERKSRLLPALEGLQTLDPVSQILPTAQAIDAAGASPAVGGNSVRLLMTGEDAFRCLEEQILSAKYSIHITTFILGRDETGRRIVNLLAQRAREGVKVRLLLDAVGCLFSSGRFVRPLRDAGGEVQRFMPVMPLSTRHSANLRNHRKIAVFDQHTAIIGGHNLARDYMGPVSYRKRFRDFGAAISGPGAALLNEVFLADWAFASGQSLDVLHNELRPDAIRPEGDSAMQIVASGPDVKGDPLYEGILSMIQEARTSILIVTPYFIPDEVLWRSLMVKARAGTEVTLILPARSNHPITDFARRHFTRELRKAGAQVRLFTPGMLHAKAVMIDHRIGLIGSANFDLRSLFVNFEIGVFLYSERDVLAMREWAKELLSYCRELKPEAGRRPRLLVSLAEDICRLFAPLL